jgi:hypothetical protein
MMFKDWARSEAGTEKCRRAKHAHTKNMYSALMQERQNIITPQ